MKKDSSRHKKGQPKREQGVPVRRYPTKDNVYHLPQAKRAPVRRGAQPLNMERKIASDNPGKGRKRSRRKYTNILPMFVFLAVALYLCGQMLSMAVKKTDVEVETIAYGTIDTPERYKGLIVRDEYVLTSTRSGETFYQYAEGDYIPKNAVVCAVKDTNSTDIIEGKLDEIDKDILKSQKSRSDLSAFSEDITRIENNIQRTVDSFAGKSMKSDMNYVRTMRAQVEGFMSQRNDIWLTENGESLTQLNEEKNTYQKQLAQNMSSARATESGIFALSFDGLEETLTPEGLETITEAQIGDGKTQYASTAKTVVEGDKLGKVVTSNQWYVVAYLPNSSVLNWSKGESQVLNLIAEEDVIQVTGKVVSLTPGDKETKVVFSTFEKMEQFMDQRTLTFQLDSETIEGLKVPNNAIVEKSLIRLPKECLTESVGKRGVLLANGDKTKFVSVNMVTSDETYVYVEQGGELQLGDVILQGMGEAAKPYTVSDLEPRSGVYLTNSSLARFVMIDILDQNQEYAVIRSGTNYGLQPYDTIVSDAKNIKEGQSIY